jgi:hypothetical protein
VSDEGPLAFRAPMCSLRDEVDRAAAVHRALELGLVGVGGALLTPAVAVDEAIAAVDRVHGERVALRLGRFAEAPDGAYVWTRSDDGMLHLGRLLGPWRYDEAAPALALDLVHVRDCSWLPDPVDPAQVPAAVSQTFARGGRNWQRIRHPQAGIRSAQLWATFAEPRI